MSDLFNTMTTTANGMTAYSEVGDSLVSLFFKIGTSRGVDMKADFLDAFRQDPDKAIRILLWSRDVRGGAGERQRFRDLLEVACNEMPDMSYKYLLARIPEIGRYDDLHVLVGTTFELDALTVHLDGIKAGNGLACKWAPRKGKIADKLRNMWGVSPKFYRKHIVQHTKVVEQLMCAGKWDEIEYSHVPSVASGIYGKAFGRHDQERYSKYLASVLKGEKTMHAGAIFPYDIYRNAKGRGNADQADAQWKSLPNYLEGSDERIIVMSDVSGSMCGLPMEISVSLGLYFAERLQGEFHNCLLTFSSKPTLVKLKEGGKLTDHFRAIETMDWGYDTNLEAAFDAILQNAVRFNVPQEKMPTKLLIISDMQFNEATHRGHTAIEMARQKFAGKGYVAPSVIFWNVNGRETGNAPARFNEKGVALVSGASPAVVKSVLGGEIDPVKVMLKTIMVDRYTI